jgi:cytochrome c peroxidase
MRNIFISILLIGFCTVLFIQCNKKTSEVLLPNLPNTPFDYSTITVIGANTTPADNAITNDGATLGRVLFYDRHLSINNQVACGSCHLQKNGFADKEAFSTGFEGNKTSRNSSAISNAVNQSTYFWDKRTTGLETMVLQPIRHQVEMGMEKPEILPKKLANIKYYPDLFLKAFGSAEVTSDKIAKALAQFLRSMASYSSFAESTHLVTSGGWGLTNDPRVTNSQKHGAQLFANNRCQSCHTGPNFRGGNDEGVGNIGLDINYTDQGIGADIPNMEGMFKIPSLRNVAKTAPYMHDGRFKSLTEVVNHYNLGIQAHPNLSPILRTSTWGGATNEPVRMNLTQQDVTDLVAFLETLTDETVISDVKFSDPFAR